MTPRQRLAKALEHYRVQCPLGLSPDWLRCSKSQDFCILGGISGTYKFHVPVHQKHALRALVGPDDEPNITKEKINE